MSSQMKTRAKKRYGQHFLRDTGTIHRIVGLIGPRPNDLLIEVGAGDGTLSLRLAPRVLRLLAIELDRDLIPVLTSALAAFPNAQVVAADVLKVDLPSLVAPHLNPEARLRVVGNLPYNIGTALIERLIFMPLPIESMIFMLQLETVERICASPGTKDYGFFSVFCRHYCVVEPGFKVSPACFIPRPKVTSAMVVLRPRRQPLNPQVEADFLEIVKAAFAYRRKQLLNSLCGNPRLEPIAERILARSGIDGSRRAEDLSVQEFEQLAVALHDMKDKGGK